MKIIQLHCWRDRLLAVGDDGGVYDMELVDETGYPRTVPRITKLWPGSIDMERADTATASRIRALEGPR